LHLRDKLYFHFLNKFFSFQRYDFSKISLKLSFKEPEFMLRCLCNFNNCNREKNFFGYIKSLKVDSEILATKTI
jgi:hypothetical protein